VKAYFISGLGADHRAFKKIVLPPQFEIVHIAWITPMPNETFKDYCLRLTTSIDRTKDFVLIGLSFGGLVVTELTPLLHPKKTIVISSITSFQQMPWYFKLLGMLRIHKLIPVAFLKKQKRFAYWLFGTKTEEERKALSRIMDEIDEVYLKWSLHEILTWKVKEKAEGIVHIHGSADKILPVHLVDPDIKINGGGHFMVLTHAAEINEGLRRELAAI
jgi:pimeloyl-ACP methyl ester carboxylesterase